MHAWSWLRPIGVRSEFGIGPWIVGLEETTWQTHPRSVLSQAFPSKSLEL